jgi:hypothetical protein
LDSVIALVLFAGSVLDYGQSLGGGLFETIVFHHGQGRTRPAVCFPALPAFGSGNEMRWTWAPGHQLLQLLTDMRRGWFNLF